MAKSIITDEIKKYIKNNYKKQGAKFIAEKYNISIKTVYFYANKFELTNINPVWSNEEISIVKNNYRGKSSLGRVKKQLEKSGYKRTEQSIYGFLLKNNKVNDFRYEYLSVSDIEKLMGFSSRKIYHLIKEKKIDSFILEKKRYFEISSLKKFMKEYTNLWNYNLINIEDFSLIYCNDNLLEQEWFINKKESDLNTGTRKLWTTKEEQKLISLFNNNISTNEIMNILKRNSNSIYNKINELRNRGLIEKPNLKDNLLNK